MDPSLAGAFFEGSGAVGPTFSIVDVQQDNYGYSFAVASTGSSCCGFASVQGMHITSYEPDGPLLPHAIRASSNFTPQPGIATGELCQLS
jgi:hypothetical protein